MAAAILDRVLERGRFIHLDGPSGRTRHLNLEEILPAKTERVIISGISGSQFPEPTGINVITIWSQTKTQPEPTVPSLYDNPPHANPRYFPKGIFGQKFSQFTTL
jgi:hypothetical protein